MAVAVTRPVVDTEISPLLRISNLAVNYGGLRALDGVDLTIHPGEAVALVGENGAGKSTLVRCIAGDLAPTTGHIYVDSKRLPVQPAAVASAGVAVVWQNLALCDNLDVAANLFLGRERRLLRSEARTHTEAARLLAGLGIPLQNTTRLVSSLSGGQRQLVAVARAMRDRPRLLVLDEPTAALGVHEAAQVEELTLNLRRQGTTILQVSHDIEQMFRLTDRLVVLRHGKVVADLDPALSHPDEVAAIISGQQIDSSPRRQLTRLHRLVDRLSSADPSSSLPLILSALGAALATDRVCIHLAEGRSLRLAASLGLPPELASAWSTLPLGSAGGPVGQAAADEAPRFDPDVRVSATWQPFAEVARQARIGSSWSVPVTGTGGLIGVMTVFRPGLGLPPRDELDLVTLYAGYAASAVERDRLVGELTIRNRILETIREVLESLAGPATLAGSPSSGPVTGLTLALHSLRDGLQADEVGLLTGESIGGTQTRDVGGASPGPDVLRCRAAVDRSGDRAEPSEALTAAAVEALSRPPDGQPRLMPGRGGGWALTATFDAPSGPTALVARWAGADAPSEGAALLGDAAHSLELALEREESERAHQEAITLRRSQELQRQFLSRLSHELRTPLTAIRGYASSLMQSDVTWDGDSQNRFLTRIGLESARLGRLVDDMLDFSAIESNILRLQPDWCELPLVLDAARACLRPHDAERVSISCPAETPVVWADHDRLEQVFVNLFDNALRHNPPETRVAVTVVTDDMTVSVSVEDDGMGIPVEMQTNPFEGHRARRTPTAGAGLGLSIAHGIVEAHGGHIDVEPTSPGTRFVIHLPVEAPADEVNHDE